MRLQCITLLSLPAHDMPVHLHVFLNKQRIYPAAVICADADVYFAKQTEEMGVKSLESFRARHADQMARDQLRE